ncbi:unnamed protein product [Zymoseptoria tritici ST99CH_3D1]|uniref:Uncharacterized protein n=1 Tax=Zymoseptoria tritici (strain ST99CH_3D7) TaxID=1276538 RepID=A0A1X7RSM6_ZYMT9|nr:unnamed protein product [Zymoseptoria tritici ST99CH_3D7]SMR51894.1 unnamed protein product [Zymoseptoria tritici ST99CH_3D1]
MLLALAFCSLLLLEKANAINELCGQYETHYQYPYIWNNNAWNKDDTGFSCTYVSQQPNASSNAWFALWRWSGDPSVKGYPNVGFQSTILPLQLQDLRQMNISASWKLAYSNASNQSIDETDTAADVALDLFADEDREKSMQSTKQKYEIMIWYARWGNSSQPIGKLVKKKKKAVVAVLGDTSFQLYHGRNARRQTVYTWLANRTMSTIDMDYAPLLGVLVDRGLISKKVYLGSVMWGIETSYATQKMNFTVDSFGAGIRTSNQSTDAAGEIMSAPGDSNDDGPPVADLLSKGSHARVMMTGYPVLLAIIGLVFLY